MRSPLALLSLVSVLIPSLASAQGTQTFTDVPRGRSMSQSIEWAAAKGLMKGYPDGTFNPTLAVDRATALTLLLKTSGGMQGTAPAGPSSYADVAEDAWYRGAAEFALENKIIDGPPAKTNLEPSRTVTREEFLKMLFLSENEDLQGDLSSFVSPLSPDMQDGSAWNYPYIRLAIARGIIAADEQGLLQPTQPLTRADIALLLYRYDQSKNGANAAALVQASEVEITRFFLLVSKREFKTARYASARLHLLVMGALRADGDSPVIRNIAIISDALASLVLSYDAGVAKQSADVSSNATRAKMLAGSLKNSDEPFPSLSANITAIADALDAQFSKKTQQ